MLRSVMAGEARPRPPWPAPRAPHEATSTQLINLAALEITSIKNIHTVRPSLCRSPALAMDGAAIRFQTPLIIFHQWLSTQIIIRGV